MVGTCRKVWEMPDMWGETQDSVGQLQERVGLAVTCGKCRKVWEMQESLGGMVGHAGKVWETAGRCVNNAEQRGKCRSVWGNTGKCWEMSESVRDAENCGKCRTLWGSLQDKMGNAGKFGKCRTPLLHFP